MIRIKFLTIAKNTCLPIKLTYHTPPRFSQAIVQQIRTQAEQIFHLFGMRDFVRLDGWVMQNGTLYFTDINPISGLEQNSFLFRQASILGMTHRHALEYILKRTCHRYQLTFPKENKSVNLKLNCLFMCYLEVTMQSDKSL